MPIYQKGLNIHEKKTVKQVAIQFHTNYMYIFKMVVNFKSKWSLYVPVVNMECLI